MHAPKTAVFQTRVVFICEQPVLGSLISDKALELIQQLEKLDKRDSLKPVIGEVNDKPDEPADCLVKAALRLSHASSVAIVTLNDISTKEGFSVLSIIRSLMATEKKVVVLFVPEEKMTEWTNALSICVDLKLLKRPVNVRNIEAQDVSSKENIMKISRIVLSTMEGFKLSLDPRKFTALIGCDKKGMK